MKHKFPSIDANNIIYNPTFEDLRLFSEELEQTKEKTKKKLEEDLGTEIKEGSS